MLNTSLGMQVSLLTIIFQSTVQAIIEEFRLPPGFTFLVADGGKKAVAQLFSKVLAQEDRPEDSRTIFEEFP